MAISFCDHSLAALKLRQLKTTQQQKKAKVFWETQHPGTDSTLRRSWRPQGGYEPATNSFLKK